MQRWMVKAVALLVLLGAVGCGSDDRATGETPDDRHLLPRHPPTSLPLCFAADTDELEARRDATEADARSVLWGDAGRPDPWSGTVASLTTDHSDHVPVHDGAVPTRVGDHAALVAPAALFQAVSSPAWGHVASWQERPGLVVEVALRGGSPDDVLRLAEQVRFDGDRPVLPADALGARTEALFDGTPLHPLGLIGGLWSVAYGVADQRFQVLGHRPDDGAVHALEFWSVHSEATTISDRPAVLYAAFDAEEGPWGVVWEDGGLTVQVVGFASREQVLRFAESLDDVSPAAWRAAKAEARPCNESP